MAIDLELTVWQAVDRAAQRDPDAVGWIFEDERITFRQMRDRSAQVAKSLVALGLGKGDVIGVWTPNLPAFAYLQFACARIGVVAASINTRSKTYELEHTLRQGDVRAIFLVDGFLKHDFIATLAEVADAPARNGRLVSAQLPFLQHVVSLSPEASDASMTWKCFLERGADVSGAAVDRLEKCVSPADPVLLQYTSGTTSRPKGALLNHRYVLNYGVQFITRMGVKAGEAYMNTQPFYHVGGSCAALPIPLMTGIRIVSPEYYTPERVLELIERESCVGRSGYSAMYLMELASPDFGRRDLSSLRAGWCVGSRPVLDRIKAAFGLADLFQIYAATEGGGTGGYAGEDWELQSLSCGTVLDGAEIAIGDRETGRNLPAGEVGEVLLRGWCMMNGYYKMPEASAAAIDAEGWLHTGDLGRLSASGHLYFVGRAKDMLKVGGENVSAEEVETVLLSHSGIAQASVIGAPDDRLGEVVLAVVERRREDLTAQEVIDYCALRLANFRVPRHVRFTTDWPMTALGKIQKNVLRDRYAPEFARKF